MDKVYSIWFNCLGINERVKFKLYNRVESYKEIYSLTKVGCLDYGLNEGQAFKLVDYKSSLDEAKFILEQCTKNNIDVVDIGSENYPKPLKYIEDPPIVIYAKGKMKDLNGVNIAIVGSRKCSEQGADFAKMFAKKLGQEGFTIVSGLAMGIDAQAHKGALVNKTIAVMGTGVDVCYPKCNIDIYSKILDRGCIISEYAPGTQSRPYHFPKRNRIISGICTAGVFVVEGGSNSGALITANKAWEQNKVIFSMPRDINVQYSKGSNELIKNGAKAVTHIDDIINSLCGDVKKKLILKPYDKKIENSLDKFETLVYDCLSWEAISKEQILRETNLEEEELEVAITKLLANKMIARRLGHRYVRI
ncbi:MAG: DNA protecting protein DprA [Epulopiscium sp. Nele67-Bin001]|nr:MAG: DNA protecting protein DprA [Epulopiscium sp. Nele67-Bin001]